MAAKTHEVRRLALIGAEGQIRAMQGEIDAIVALFPELRNGQPVARRAKKNEGPPPSARKKRGPQTAAARKAMSVRMKQYWAGRKKEAAKNGQAGREGASLIVSRGGRGRLPARSNGIPPHWRKGDAPKTAAAGA